MFDISKQMEMIMSESKERIYNKVSVNGTQDSEKSWSEGENKNMKGSDKCRRVAWFCISKILEKGIRFLDNIEGLQR